MKRSILLIASVLASLAAAQTSPVPKRPRIVGVANIAVWTDNLEAARKFYGQQLGYAEPFQVARPEGGAVFKVNDRQYVEVYPGWKGPEQLVLAHIAFETDDARQLRDYLAGNGVKVSETLAKDPDGNLSFTIKDPDGHDVEFVQYLPGSLQARNFGKALPPTRVSERIIHVGTTVSDRAPFDHLYRDILGFREFWHGGMRDDQTSWVDMRVPDGTDWYEYMLTVKNPSPRTLGVMNHMALGVPDVQAGYKTIQSRGLMPAEGPKIGRDGKWQLNLYDANLTRTELMEPKPVQTPCCSPMLDPAAPAIEVPDWALPGSATHKQVPPPADFHRPSRTFETPIGVFDGQSDVGSALVPGSAAYDAAARRYTISSAGYNIWYSRDEFRFLWKKMAGDASLAADVTFPDSQGYGDRKAVLVIRQNLDDDSKEAMLGEHGVGMIHLAQRPERGANMKDMQYRFGGMLANVRAKRVGIEKRGDSIAIFVSLQGEPMQQLGPPIKLHFDEPFYVGIGFCSHLPDKSDTAVLSDVVLENAAGKVR
jgi:catechol 2,3-dioxygenase-like lactoylglutathione lyase family enzyme